jgi:hypothetical protein
MYITASLRMRLLTVNGMSMLEDDIFDGVHMDCAKRGFAGADDYIRHYSLFYNWVND